MVMGRRSLSTSRNGYWSVAVPNQRAHALAEHGPLDVALPCGN